MAAEVTGSATATETVETGSDTGPAAIPAAREGALHYVVESLRLGIQREVVRQTLYTRIVTVLGEMVEAKESVEQMNAALDMFVTCVNLLDQTHLVDASEPIGTLS